MQISQMDEILQWIEQFERDTFNTEEEILVFDVLGGDFNLDNMSPGDVFFQCA